ncbi:TPA: hypothetical protein RTG57_001727 [Campylobacter jejuni]|nr:hypothetical protein [Campylobacter jejuni]
MTKEALLRTAIKSFKDNFNKVNVYSYKLVTTDQGYSYIVKNSKSLKELECAIHYDANYNYNEDKGSLREVDVSVITREKLPSDVLIEYQDLTILIKSYTGFNNSMGQYEYIGRAITSDKLKLLTKLKGTYGYSVFDKLIDIDDFIVIPKYLTKNDKFNGKVVLYEKIDSETISMVNPYSNDLTQTLTENSEFILINSTREDVLTFIRNLEKLSLEGSSFGIVSTINTEELNDVDTYFSLKGISYKISVKLCYNINMKKANEAKIIKNVLLIYNDASKEQ